MAPRPPDVRTVDVGDGLVLHVERDGPSSDEALLLLHGFTGSAASWSELRPALRDRSPVIAVDLPGHGRSSAPDDPRRYALERLADDLERVTDRLGVRAVVALGYSLGGRAALKFALRHPARVRGLILESTSPGIERADERDARARSDTELVELLQREGIAAFVDRWEMLPLWASQAALPPERRAALRTQRLSQSARGLANSLRGAGAAADPAVFDRLGDIRVPTLLVAGALDLKYVDYAMRMSERLADARVEIVPDAGHAVHLEQPDHFARIVTSFLRNLNPRQAGTP